MLDSMPCSSSRFFPWLLVGLVLVAPVFAETNVPLSADQQLEALLEKAFEQYLELDPSFCHLDR